SDHPPDTMYLDLVQANCRWIQFKHLGSVNTPTGTTTPYLTRPRSLDPDWLNPQRADQLLSTAQTNFRQRADQPIGSALLDQRLVSGIGNIYRCEVLSLTRMNPYRRVGTLTDAQLVGLIVLARD